MAKPKQYSYWTTDAALYEAVKAHAATRGLMLSTAVTQALTAWVDATAPGSAFKAAIDRPPKPTKRLKALAKQALTPPPQRSSPLNICRRCQHPEAAHWKRGCLGGCICREFAPLLDV